MIKIENKLIYELHKRSFERLIFKIGRYYFKYVRLCGLWKIEIRKGE